MAWITRIVNGRQVRYWTERQVGCDTGGRLAREPVWVGAGLGEVGLVAGERADPQAVERLLYGRHPATGEVLRVPKPVVHPDAMLDATGFAQALRDLAAGQDAAPEQVLHSQRSRARWGRLARALGQRKPEPLVPYTDLLRLAKDAGLPLGELFDPGVLAFARANRHKRDLDGVLGYGLTLNWPKSLSAVAALVSSRIARIISEEVMAVVTEVAAAAEELTGYGLRGHQGDGQLAQHVAGRGLLGVALPHFQARRTKGHPGDPHLHIHLTFANLLPCEDGKWRAFGNSGKELHRYVAVLGEFAKARLRQRLNERLGMEFERVRSTGEWEAVGVPIALLRLWSRRSRAVQEAAPGARAGERRVVAAKLAERERNRRWLGVLLLERWLGQARTVVGDVHAMLAATIPGRAPGSALPEPPTLAEVVAGLRLPRRAAKRRRGVEHREVLTAVIATYPASLRTLAQAVEMTDQVLASAGFELVKGPWGTSWRDTARYRVPPALVAASRRPVGRRDRNRTSTKKPGRQSPADQGTLPLPVPQAQLTRPKATLPPPRAERTDQVLLDLGLDQPTTTAGIPDIGEGQLQFDVPDRDHLDTPDPDLADQITAAQAALKQAQDQAEDHRLAAALLLAQAGAGAGEAWARLRLRRTRLAAAADLERSRTELLAQAGTLRDGAKEDQRRAKRLRELAAKWHRGPELRLEATGLIEDPDDDTPPAPGGHRRLGGKALNGHAQRLEDRARDRGLDAKAATLDAARLRGEAADLARLEGVTVERALIEDAYGPADLAAQEAVALAADVQALEDEQAGPADEDRAAIDAAVVVLEGLCEERDLRARMPAYQRRREDQLRFMHAQQRERERASRAAGARPASPRRAGQQQTRPTGPTQSGGRTR